MPVAGWPVAFAGVAWFGGLLAAWIAARGGWPRTLAWVARAGGLASLAFVALAWRSDALCPWCLTVQGASLAFLVASERAVARARAPGAELAFAVVALLATAFLGAARTEGERRRHAADERALAESTRAIADPGAGRRGFTGRWRRGPERAPIRLVMFTDYQCPDCARVEADAWRLVEARDDLSLSVKHFPLCADCNVRARALGQSPHPNACWAARAAEAAGMLHGADGFWRMHRWLFERRGAFTDADLARGLAELGLDDVPFVETLHSAETLARVEADVAEAIALGIQSTPMVFLNGVELRGWRAPDALARAVEALAASAPEPAGPEADAPPDALAKALADWRLEPVVELSVRDEVVHPPGTLPVVVFGDYLDPTTRELDALVRAACRARPEASYAFRHYPLDPACVPGVPARNPGACRIATAAEAARLAGDADAFARFHAALMEAPLPIGESRLRELAAAHGLDLGALLASSAAAAAVRADVAAARAAGIHAVPLLLVGEKRVPRWRLDGVELVELVLDEALAGR